MSKLIQFSGRNGTGITTLSSIIAEKLSEEGTVLIIDNSKNKTIYDITSSRMTDIRPYIAMNDGKRSGKAIRDCAIEIKKNLYYISSINDDKLEQSDIEYIYDLQIFDYIIIDDSETYVISEYEFIVINPNTKEQEQYKNSEATIIINRYNDEIEYKIDKDDFIIYFTPEIMNFSNGFELILKGHNKKEIEKIIQSITGQKSNSENKKKWVNILKKLERKVLK